MQRAILVPGRPDKDQHYDPKLPSNSENYWFSWLRRQLILNDIHAVSIEPPHPYRPRYDEWKREFEKFEIMSDTILVGHSCGGGFLIRYLSENKDLKVGRVILVAPWINPLSYEAADVANFFKFSIDKYFPARTQSVEVFISSDDDPSVVKTVEILKQQAEGINYHEYNDQGHFKEDKYPEFLQIILD